MITSVPEKEGQAAQEDEKWYVITMGGSPVGYLHETEERAVEAAGPVVRVSSEMKMVLNRLGTKVELDFLSSTEETAAGLLRRLTSELKASILSTRTEAVVRDGKIEVRSEAAGKSYTRTIDYSGEILGPEGIRLLSLKRLKDPGDAVEYQTFEAELATVTRGTRKVLARETIEAAGRAVPTLKIEETIEAGGVTATAWLDANGEALKQVMPTPFGEGVIVLADRGTALAAAAGGELPPEMFERSIIRSNIRLPKARDIERLLVRMRSRSPGAAWPDIKLPSQTEHGRADGSLEIEVLRPDLPPSAGFPAPATDANREYLEANAYIQSDDAGIKALAAKIIGGVRDRFAAVVKLRDWVGANMTFDLGIVVAPSTEILRDRRGTCVGYATLVAALARAAGIPSRVVIGYVYALGMFGGHAWTEVDAGGRWVPIDAAVPSAGIADAARIGLVATSFRDGAGSLAAGGVARLFGQVDIRVLEFKVSGGTAVSVPEGEKPYRVAGDDYVNPWLGLSFRKPAAFSFSKLDSVWPDPTLLALERRDGTTASLSEGLPRPWSNPAGFASAAFSAAGIEAKPVEVRRLGRPAFLASAPTAAGLVVIDGPQAWTLSVKGPSAGKVLNELVAGWTLRDRPTLTLERPAGSPPIRRGPPS